jgi:hypothetical protein
MPRPTGPVRAPADVQQLVGTSTRAPASAAASRARSTRRSSAIWRCCTATPTARTSPPAASTCRAGVRPDDPSVVGDHPARVWSGSTRSTAPTRRSKRRSPELPARALRAHAHAERLLRRRVQPGRHLPGHHRLRRLLPERGQAHAVRQRLARPSNERLPARGGLAVDYNGNGVRDELEPIIRSGHEPWVDARATDGLLSASEPGYALGTNEDPRATTTTCSTTLAAARTTTTTSRASPSTTWASTASRARSSSSCDRLDASGRRLRRRRERRRSSRRRAGSSACGIATIPARHRAGRRPTSPRATRSTDEALARLDLWTDGGTRDIFNFHVDAQHLAGSMAARGATPRSTPTSRASRGSIPRGRTASRPAKIPWDDVPGSSSCATARSIPSDADIEKGSGQHVGTADEILSPADGALLHRLALARPELRSVVETSNEDPAERAGVRDRSAAAPSSSPRLTRPHRPGHGQPPARLRPQGAARPHATRSSTCSTATGRRPKISAPRSSSSATG